VLGQYVGEQAHQQMKEELGLDHYEGRSWQGLHRHTLMTMSPPRHIGEEEIDPVQSIQPHARVQSMSLHP
jgi:isopentenyldiphosphate isomerase